MADSLRTRALAAPMMMLACVAASPAASAYTLGDEPAFVVPGSVVTTTYDGVTDDLLTAGLGKTGLSGAAPTIANTSAPTKAELRRLAIYANYRALIDPKAGGGFGTFFGPNVTVDGTPTTSEGKIPGTETLVLTRVSSKHANVAATVGVMVQIPDSYNVATGCIVTAPSSGSRGIYGAIATAGEWGLKHGCAVAYTDKGSGTGADDLQNNMVNLEDGTVVPAPTAGQLSSFTARVGDAQRAAFDAATPNRFAFKHAHSQANPESDWGSYVLQSVQVAFWVLNQRYGTTGRPYPVTRANTLVLASSVSNGGGASLRAAEEDTSGLIDGVAVAEPNVNPTYTNAFSIRQGTGTPLVAHSRTLMDYITLENLYAGCAAVAPTTPAAPLNLAPSPGRCAALQAAGLLTSTTTAAQATEAQGILNAYGILPEQNFVSPSHWFAYVHQSIAVTYANAYGKFAVTDNLCGYSMGATAAGTGVPIPLPTAAEQALFGNSNGIPPTGGVNLIANLAAGGPKEDRVSSADQDLAGALCLRGLATGKDPVTGAALTGAAATQSLRIAQGVQQILATGNLHGIPAVYVAGRNDGILPPNFAGRAYYGLNKTVEGAGSSVRYYEVTNAQHLDSFNQYAGFDSTLVPLHVYFLQAMDMMYAHLRSNAPLAPSQVVHTTPRGPGAPPLAASNVPPISMSPPAAAQITLSGGVLTIPD